ncbi:MAG: biopolymer transporter ExbD [Desulfobulbaceae bacterium]|nr:biopolymer transporter ExbD [Desulfobulbaceae bacterium]
MKVRRKGSRQPRVEMLPLIDIVFLLLIFFIYAMLSMAVHRGLNLDLPESSTAQTTKQDALSISVKRYDSGDTGLLILINDDRVALESLGQKLRKMSENAENQQVLIFAEETISYQELFQVLDQVKSGGIKEISLQANKDRE